MKRYIKSSSYPDYYDYWDNPASADRVTDIELPDDIKSGLIQDEIEHVGDKWKYGSLNTTDYDVMWDVFLSYFVGRLEWALDDHPEASWPTWYEDAKARFDEWYNWWNS